MRLFFSIGVLIMFFDVFCAENSPADVCDPHYGRIIVGEHFVSDEFITTDGNWNYKTWNKHRKNQEAFIPDKNCIPIENKESLEDKIEKLDKTIDLLK